MSKQEAHNAGSADAGAGTEPNSSATYVSLGELVRLNTGTCARLAPLLSLGIPVGSSMTWLPKRARTFLTHLLSKATWGLLHLYLLIPYQMRVQTIVQLSNRITTRCNLPVLIRDSYQSLPSRKNPSQQEWMYLLTICLLSPVPTPRYRKRLHRLRVKRRP